jgi:hypothetical protein
MGTGVAGDLGPGPRERQNFKRRAEAGQEFETARRVCAGSAPNTISAMVTTERATSCRGLAASAEAARGLRPRNTSIAVSVSSRYRLTDSVVIQTEAVAASRNPRRPGQSRR